MIPVRFLFQLVGQCQALYQIPEFVSQPVLQIKDIPQADDQLVDGLGVYELMLEEENDDSEENDPAKMYSTGVRRFDEPISVVEKPIKEINLGTKNDPRDVIISQNLTPEEERALSNILKEYKDTFAWTYEDMPSLNPTLVEHRLPIKPGARAVNQKLQRLHPKTALQVKEEVDKLHKAKFIKVVLYLQWVANIVLFIKKNRQV